MATVECYIVKFLSPQFDPLRNAFFEANRLASDYCKPSFVLQTFLDAMEKTFMECFLPHAITCEENFINLGRAREKLVTIVVEGNKIPLYGSGAGLSTPTGTTNLPVPLELNFIVRSKAYVLGKPVKPRFYKTIGGSMVLDPKKLNAPTMFETALMFDSLIDLNG
ncbi:hypothetical protein Syun_015278 [Stephania yunnanensis]|uniref:Uncharacterized protein n=1 Tax=Stephania yunnanensis TaxID=152371 RepID=A0AAP0JML1_9MAGN